MNVDAILVSGLRCFGIDDDCCSEAHPCGFGDGDCDDNTHCTGDLTCGTDNCPWDTDDEGSKDDCCRSGIVKCTSHSNQSISGYFTL